jgi:hypothetical protein
MDTPTTTKHSSPKSGGTSNVDKLSKGRGRMIYKDRHSVKGAYFESRGF